MIRWVISCLAYLRLEIGSVGARVDISAHGRELRLAGAADNLVVPLVRIFRGGPLIVWQSLGGVPIVIGGHEVDIWNVHATVLVLGVICIGSGNHLIVVLVDTLVSCLLSTLIVIFI